MSRYSSFLGRVVDVTYRAGDICLPASGKFVGDSGRSIFLEQHFEQHGQLKNFRWEIPYSCVVRLEESERFAVPAPQSIAALHEDALSSFEEARTAATPSADDASQPILASRAKTA